MRTVLRTVEFLKEGHTVHATRSEAEESEKMMTHMLSLPKISWLLYLQVKRDFKSIEMSCFGWSRRDLSLY
jgi:hypothetical protein